MLIFIEMITMDDILGTLKDDPNTGALRQQVESMKKAGGALSTPLGDLQRQQIDREIRYEDTQKMLSSKWVPQMVHNKHKEAQFFGYDDRSNHVKSTAMLVEKFQPQTNLEAELLIAAKESGLTDEGMKKADALGTAPLEIHEHRRRVARLKAILSAEQRRSKRLSKIKSKTYHRIQKRAEARQKESLLERLEVENPALALQLREEAERKRAVMRAQKRANARQKWAAAANRFGGQEMRKEISHQAQRAQDEKEALNRMARVKPGGNYMGGSESNSDLDSDVVNSSDSESEADDTSRARSAILAELEAMEDEANNAPKGIMSLPFMQRAKEAERSAARAAAEQMLENLEKRIKAGENFEDEDEISFHSDEDEQKKKDQTDDSSFDPFNIDTKRINLNSIDLESAEQAALKALGISTGQNTTGAMASIKTDGAVTVNVNAKGNKTNNQEDKSKLNLKEKQTNIFTTTASLSSKKQIMKQSHQKTISTKIRNEDNADEDEGHQFSKKRRRTARNNKKGENNNNSKVATSPTETQQAPAITNVATIRSSLLAANEVDGGDVEESILRGFDREEGDSNLIRQAFLGDEQQLEQEWNDNLADEEEKAEADKNGGKGSLPGWGAGWAGQVLSDKTKKKEKEIAERKKKESEKRKAQKRPLIQVSNKLDRKATKYQVSEVPREYAGDINAYEATLTRPLGPEWNTIKSHQRFTQPKINVRVGAVVAPLEHAKHLPAQQQDSLLRAWDSRKKKGVSAKARL